MPTVSVIIPTYNRADLILETIKSVLDQSYSDYEIIVVDDGSTDDTQSRLQSLIDSKEIIYFKQKKAGQAAARNRGIREATGTYLAFLDSDDLFFPNKLEKQVAVLKANVDVGMVHCNYAKFDSVSGADLGVRDTSYYTGWVYPQLLNQWGVFMAVPCMVVRREVFDKVGSFDEALQSQEDPELWARIARDYQLAHIPEVLVRVRMHEASVSSDKTDAAITFRAYLDKVFSHDSDLSLLFKRRVLGKMYANAALNLLGDGQNLQMKMVRKNSFKSIGAWPFNISAYVALFVSLIPARLRAWLFEIWKTARYKEKV